MNILSVNNTADIYGASRCMERVLGRFAKGGHEVHAVVPEQGPLVELLEAQGVRVHIHRGLPIVDRSQLKSWWACLKSLVLFPISVIWLAILALRFRIDVIHTNTLVMPSPAIAALITGRPHVWHVREMMGEFGRMWKLYQRYISILSSAVIAISNCTRDQFDPGPRNKVQVIYDGLDGTVARVEPSRRDAFRSSFQSDKVLVGVVGRIKWHRKGQEVLVRAAALLKKRHPQVHYVLVGSPAPGNQEHETRLRALIAASGLENDFTLAGDIDDAISVFAALDIAVVPSVQAEPFGCVVIEAMTAGTPVVGSRCGGIAEQIVDGVSGLLFTPGDYAALADALDRLLNDRTLRDQMADQGFQRVRSAFSLDSTYLHTAALFDQVAAAGFNASLRRNPL
jgi:glycosyltransferase involved in cell wall biosynthesis